MGYTITPANARALLSRADVTEVSNGATRATVKTVYGIEYTLYRSVSRYRLIIRDVILGTTEHAYTSQVRAVVALCDAMDAIDMERA